MILLLKQIPMLVQIYNKFVYHYHKYLYSKDPRALANRSYKKFFHKDIDWRNPKDLIEKIIYMQFNSDTALWTKLADKFQAREYISLKCGNEYLPKLYGKYIDANDIDFDALPSKFVIKTNNGCGTVLLIKNKNTIDTKAIVRKVNNWLKIDYGYVNAQKHYLSIPKCIIIEEFLHSSNKNDDSPLIDYKFHCFNGVPECCLVVSSRNSKKHTYKLNLYDMQWRDISNNLCSFRGNEGVSCPKSLNIMIDLCHKLGQSIPYVRIDFYEIDGFVYVGELTFTTGFGYMTNDYYLYLGKKLAIN